MINCEQFFSLLRSIFLFPQNILSVFCDKKQNRQLADSSSSIFLLFFFFVPKKLKGYTPKN